MRIIFERTCFKINMDLDFQGYIASRIYGTYLRPDSTHTQEK